MKTSLIIEARSQSKRLPNKILKYCYKKVTFLEYMIRRLKRLKFIDNIIIATTNHEYDDKIVSISKKLKVDHFRGSENNVIQRVIRAAKHYQTDLIVRATSDCPLIDLDLISQAYNIFLRNKVDYVSNGFIRSYPLGMDVEIFKYKVLKKSYLFAKNKDSLEHVSLSIRRNPKLFKHLNIVAPNTLNYPKLELTLDYYEDYLLLKHLIRKFWNKNYNCYDLVAYLNKNKKIAKINKNVKRTKYNYQK